LSKTSCRVVYLLLCVTIFISACKKDTSGLIEESRFLIDEGKYQAEIEYLETEINKNPAFDVSLLRGATDLQLYV